MIEWLIGFLVAYWWVYKKKKKENKQQGNRSIGNISHNGVPLGYYKWYETERDLI